MAVYSKKHNFLFLASPQTGSKAINKTLIEQLEGEQIPKSDVRKNGKVVANKHHTTIKMLLNSKLLTQEEVKTAFKFVGVRNPYDLLVSRYMKLRGRFAAEGEKANWAKKNDALAARVTMANEMAFPDWLKEVHSEFLSGERTFKGPMLFLDGVDHVIRFEKLQEGFDEAMRRIGIPGKIEVAQFNVTTERVDSGKKKDFREFYDASSIALVQRLYAPVIEQFGYQFDPA